MRTETREKINATFLNIVEQLTFMFGEPLDKGDLITGGVEFTLAVMTFHGDLEGDLSVAVPTGIRAEIAANILGLEPEDIDSEELLTDALQEMLNVVCGHVIMALAGAEANFKLDAPQTQFVDEDKLASMMEDDGFCGFELDENPVFLGLHLRD